MPLIIKDTGNEGNIILNEVSFHIDSGNYFKVTNGFYELFFEFTPKFEKEWDYSKYELFLFDNPYFDAENDVFEIYIKNQEGRAGWIFPITLLESNENDYVDYKNLNGYKFVAYHLLLRSNKLIQIKNNRDNYKLTDIFDETTKICLLSKEDINRNSIFDLNEYLLSYYTFGYSLQHKEYNYQLRQRNWFRDIESFRVQNNKLSLQESSFEFKSNDYIFNIFTNHLLVAENNLVRFILLYQVIEELMHIESEQQINDSILRFQRKNISKNDFKTELNEISSEANLIFSIFEKTPIDADLQRDFTNKCVILFEAINYEPKNKVDFNKILYSFRNLVTHNYRLLIDKKEELDKIISDFEFIVVQLLINYGKKKVSEKQELIEVSVGTIIESEELIPVEKAMIKSSVEIIKTDIPEIKGVKVIGRIDLSKLR